MGLTIYKLKSGNYLVKYSHFWEFCFIFATGFKFRRYALWQQEMRTLHPSWQCILV